MDADAKAHFFKMAILMLQVEERAVKRELEAFNLEKDRDKRRWRRLWEVLNVAAESDETDEATGEELKAQLAHIQSQIARVSNDLAALT